MTANQLFTDIQARGQKFLSVKQTAWLRSMVMREFPEAQSISSPYEFNWMHESTIRTLFVRPCEGTGRILSTEVK
jgi:hypothetical protein